MHKAGRGPGVQKKADLNGACDELWNGGLTWNAFLDYEVFKWEIDRHAPGAVHLNWLHRVTSRSMWIPTGRMGPSARRRGWAVT